MLLRDLVLGLVTQRKLVLTLEPNESSFTLCRHLWEPGYNLAYNYFTGCQGGETFHLCPADIPVALDPYIWSVPIPTTLMLKLSREDWNYLEQLNVDNRVLTAGRTRVMYLMERT